MVYTFDQPEADGVKEPKYLEILGSRGLTSSHR